MILISHRGNINGPKSHLENKPEYIHEALIQDFDVEVDVWYVDGEFWLGHDKPQYKVSEGFLEHSNLWCHAKNIQALYVMSKSSNIHYFWHQKDDVTLTSRGYLWTYPGKELTKKSICVLPEVGLYKLKLKTILSDERVKMDFIINIFGVCSDYIARVV